MNDGNTVADATDAAEGGCSSAGTNCKSAGSNCKVGAGDAGSGEPKFERIWESRVVDSTECRSENRRTPVMHG